MSQFDEKLFKSYLSKKGISENSVMAYLSRAKNYISFLSGGEVSQNSIQSYLESIDHLSRQTKYQTYFALKNVAEFAGIEFNLKNAYNGTEFVNRKMPSTKEVKHIFRVINAYSGIQRIRAKAIVSVLLFTGLRIDEARCINISDINFDDHTIFIRNGKGGKQRTVLMNSATAKAIKEYVAARNVDHEKLFLSHGKNHKNELINYGTFRQIIKSILSDAGIGHMNPYSFRHAFATNLNKLGLAPEVIGDLMGHSSQGSLLPYYIVPSQISALEAVEKLCEMAA